MLTTELKGVELPLKIKPGDRIVNLSSLNGVLVFNFVNEREMGLYRLHPNGKTERVVTVNLNSPETYLTDLALFDIAPARSLKLSVHYGIDSYGNGVIIPSVRVNDRKDTWKAFTPYYFKRQWDGMPKAITTLLVENNISHAVLMETDERYEIWVFVLRKSFQVLKERIPVTLKKGVTWTYLSYTVKSLSTVYIFQSETELAYIVLDQDGIVVEVEYLEKSYPLKEVYTGKAGPTIMHYLTDDKTCKVYVKSKGKKRTTDLPFEYGKGLGDFRLIVHGLNTNTPLLLMLESNETHSRLLTVHYSIISPI